MDAARRGLLFAFATVALDMLALGAIAPVLVPLVERFYAGDVATATVFIGTVGTLFALMQFVWAPVLGVLSDRFGRKPVLVLSGFGGALDYAVMALAPTAAWLFAGRTISGITSASAATASAYIADITPPERRAGAFGMLGAAFGVGFVVGPAIGGALGTLGDRVPFWTAAALCAVNGLFGAFVVPESLAREHRAARFAWAKANPLGSLRLLRSHPELATMSIVAFASALAGMVMPTTWVLYVIYRYHWNPAMTGASLALVGICSMLVQAVVTAKFTARFGERAALFAGIGSGALGLAICGSAPNGVVFAIGIVPLCLWGLASGALQALMSRRVLASEQGELQGALGSLRGLAALAGPALFTTAFAIGIRPGFSVPGAGWYLGAVLLLAAVIPALRAVRAPGPLSAV